MRRLAEVFDEGEIGACRREIRFGCGQIGPYPPRFPIFPCSAQTTPSILRASG